MNAVEVLQGCTIEGNVVKLPPEQLDRKLYMEVASKLNLIGGTWKGGKIMGFQFHNDPTDLLAQIAGGEKRNLKKEFQFFATPPDIAAYLVKLAEIKEGMSILEPSAGQGAIIEQIYKAFPYYMKGPNDKPCVTVDYFELMDINESILGKKIHSDIRWSSSTSWMGADFLNPHAHIKTRWYDRIIANPPFAKNADIEHVYQMYEFCKPGGRIVSVVSKHWKLSNNQKEKTFRNWLKQNKTKEYTIEKGAFKSSGTMIESLIIVIDKK